MALKPVTPTMLDAGSETQADEDQVSDEAYDNDCERDGDCKTEKMKHQRSPYCQATGPSCSVGVNYGSLMATALRRRAA